MRTIQIKIIIPPEVDDLNEEISAAHIVVPLVDPEDINAIGVSAVIDALIRSTHEAVLELLHQKDYDLPAGPGTTHH